jgi:cytochrome P450
MVRTSLETLGLELQPDSLISCRSWNKRSSIMAGIRYRAGAEPAAAGQASARSNRDLLDALIEAHDSGGLSAVEMNNLLIFLFVAGYDTSKNVLTLIMYELLTRPQRSTSAAPRILPTAAR